MENFVWGITIVLGIDVTGKICWLGMGRVPERTTKSMAIDAFVGILFIGWGFFSLITNT